MTLKKNRSYRTAGRSRAGGVAGRLLVPFLAACAITGPFSGASAEAPSASVRRVSVQPSLYAITKSDLRDFFLHKSVPPVNAVQGDRYVALLKNDVKITYTIDIELQQSVERFFRASKVNYGAFVAVEPATGRILALVSYSRNGREEARPIALRASFPAASLFKLVTVSAALQENKITPQTTVRFRGGTWSMNRSVLLDNPRRDHNHLTIEEALAKSCNHCFGKVATRWVGARTLENYTDAYGFNAPFSFEVPVETSRATIPRDPYELARTGAGFGDVYFSPLHAALLAATIANHGRMMEPTIVEKIEDAQGNVLYLPERRVIGNPITAEVAQEINRMMVKTVEIGTSRRSFNDFVARFPDVQVAGKTGTLRGTDPPGNYFWFAGSAPVDHPRIAVAALVIAQDRWQVKGNQVAKRALEAYFSRHAH